MCAHMKKNRIKLCVTYFVHLKCFMGFPDSSVGKESACNAGDLGSIPGSGRSTGEGIGYPLQYSWASLVAQLIKNLPAMWETLIWSRVGKIRWRRERLPTPDMTEDTNYISRSAKNQSFNKTIQSFGWWKGGGRQGMFLYLALVANFFSLSGWL